MSYSLTWMPRVLLDAGLKVAVEPGWESRGRAEMGNVLGVMCHATGGPRQGNMPSLHTLVHGRADLPGPLAQLGLGRDGAFYVIAAGRCNHAGVGEWLGISTGNNSFIGIEAENTGRGDEPWPDVQMDAFRRGAAALLVHVGRSAEFCAGHKEYARPAGRKVDPAFDMAAFRQQVAQLMARGPSVPELIPAVEDEGTARRPTLRRGASGSLVTLVQRAVGAPVDGEFGAHTEAALREFQRRHGRVPDGIVGPKTWKAIDAA